MPISLDPTLRDLNDCDGCDGISPETPLRLNNRAGLDQIPYRVGTHGRFLQSMLARLSSAKYPMLQALNTRDTNDLTIAFLDACAAVDDGLTFYTERYAQEWFVRTATERVSLVQLARLIGYEPWPGVAANTFLAFTIEDTPGTPEKTVIEAGVRVLSIPGKDELPQTFETSAAIEARSAWNAMKVRTRAPQAVSTAMTQVVLKGLEGGIRRGDSVLIVISDTETDVKRVRRVVQDPAAGETTLELGAAPTPSVNWGSLVAVPYIYGQIPSLTDNVFNEIFTGNTFNASDTAALTTIFGWSPIAFIAAANTPPPPSPAETGVYALRQRAAIFGHNAPSWANLPQIVQGQSVQITGRVLIGSGSPESNTEKWQYPNNWDNLSLADAPGTHTVDLDNTYPAMTKDSWIVLESPAQAAQAYRVSQNQALTRNDYTLSVKVTRLTLTTNTHFSNYKMRETTVLGQSEQLPLATVPLTADVAGDSVTLDKYYPGLSKGQLVIVSGTRTDLNGVVGHEVRTLAEVQANGQLEAGRLFTVLKFTNPLSYTYKPETVTINANVAPATHGETKNEILGGGDSSQRYQTFILKQKPLTYLSAPTPTGAQSSLEVRVNDVLWTEVSSLYNRSPEEQVYVIRHEDDGVSKVQFNAPLPSGQENVQAKYRVGIGQVGLVKANQLTLLTIKPLGVRSVTNPLASSGAEDRERIEDLRQNSPLTVLTLDRLVSLKDYEDFARAFAGFSKAQAIPTADGSARGIFLTVAGETGVVEESSTEFSNLVAALKTNGDPFVRIKVKPYRPVFFQIEATIGVDNTYLPEKVVQAVQTVLRARFSFAARRFGQPVTAVEVIAAIQNVAGVVYVDLKYLFLTDPLSPLLSKSLQDVLPAAKPLPGTSYFTAQAAELLILDPRPIQIATVKV
ncbi:MAG: putative baseplate assembly protein [Anaerolineae bacterium]|nr:putative baseplate assembly protein [Anaerolineae bacterium]